MEIHLADWEKELETLLPYVETELGIDSPSYGPQTVEEVKAFIRQLLKEQREEMAQEVRNMGLNGGCGCEACLRASNFFEHLADHLATLNPKKE